MSVGYRTMSMAEMSTILRNLQRSLESLQSQVNSLSGGGGGIGGGATSHNLLSTTHSDTEADTVVQGDLIVGGATPTWERLALGASGTFLKSDGSDPSWATLQASDIDTLALLLDQTTPQTIVNGIPLLDKEYDDFSEPKQFVNKGYVDWIATAIGANYYMTDDTDGDTGYKVCSLTPSAGSETYIEESGVTDGQLLGAWISDVGEAPAKLPRGMYDWFIFAEKTSGTKTLRLYWELYERKTDTSEVLIATSSESNELKMGEKTSYVVPLALDSDYTPDAGSRIVGKIYASVSGGGNAPTVKIYYQGASGSRWEIPSTTEILNNIYIKRDEIGIDDDDILQVDQAAGLTASNLVRATSSGLESRTDAEILAQLSGKASSAFDWNGQDLVGIGDLSINGDIEALSFIDKSVGHILPAGALISNGLSFISINFLSSDGWTTVTTGSGIVSFSGGLVVFDTGTTANSVARMYSGSIIKNFYSGFSNRVWNFKIDAGGTSLTSADVYFGVSDSTAELTDTTKMIGFKVSSADSGLIYAHTADGTNSTNTSTGITWSASWGLYVFSIVLENTTVKFYINGTLKATITTNLPSAMPNGRLVFQVKSSSTTQQKMRAYLGYFVD